MGKRIFGIANILKGSKSDEMYYNKNMRFVRKLQALCSILSTKRLIQILAVKKR